MKIDEKTRVNMSGTLPEEVSGGTLLGEMVARGDGRVWHRDLYTTDQGYVVFDWTPHDLMPDCTVGWLKGYMDHYTVVLEHPEFMKEVNGEARR